MTCVETLTFEYHILPVECDVVKQVCLNVHFVIQDRQIKLLYAVAVREKFRSELEEPSKLEEPGFECRLKSSIRGIEKMIEAEFSEFILKDDIDGRCCANGIMKRLKEEFLTREEVQARASSSNDVATDGGREVNNLLQHVVNAQQRCTQ